VSGLPLADRIARDRALVAARLADLPRRKLAEREAKRRGAAIAAVAAARMAETKAMALAAAEVASARRAEERTERRRRRKLARRQRRQRGQLVGRTRETRPTIRQPLEPRRAKPEHFYGSRTTVLRSLGYSTYRAYLESDRWAKIRDRIMRLDGWACRCCGAPCDQVHHTSYSKNVLLGHDDKHLHSVCRECHEWVEFHGGVVDDANRRTPYEMVAETERLLAARALRVAVGADPRIEAARLDTEAVARIEREG